MTMAMHARDQRCTLGTSARIQLAAGKTSFGPPAFASLPTFTQITNALSHHGHGLHDRTHEYYLRHAHAALKVRYLLASHQFRASGSGEAAGISPLLAKAALKSS